MMVLLSVGLVLLMAGVLIITICFSAALSIMPYISGALISLAVSTEVPFAKGIVPDHENGWIFFDFVPGDIDVRRGSPAYTGLITGIGEHVDLGQIKEIFQVK